MFGGTNLLHAKGSSKLPGTLCTTMFCSFTPAAFSLFTAPSSKFAIISAFQRACTIAMRSVAAASGDTVSASGSAFAVGAMAYVYKLWVVAVVMVVRDQEVQCLPRGKVMRRQSIPDRGTQM